MNCNMKTIIFIFIFSTIVYSQTARQDRLNEILNDPGKKVEQLQNNPEIVKITDIYSNMFELWRRIDISTPETSYLQFYDTNNNGLIEVYGNLWDTANDIFEWGFWEYDSLFENYGYHHKYPFETDSICRQNFYSEFSGIYDISSRH